MSELSGFPYFEVEFTKEGALFKPQQVKDLVTFLTTNVDVSDLIVISHGWNNDNSEAKNLYERFFASLRVQANGMPNMTKRKFAILGVLWPSKKFADKDLIPGGGAASINNDQSIENLRIQLKGLKGFFSAKDADSQLDKAAELLEDLEDSPAARKKFVALIRNMLPKSAINDEDASDLFFKLDEKELLDRLSEPLSPLPEIGKGGAANVESGGAAGGIGDVLGGLFSGAKNLLNFTTYYQMKERAGVVGSKGLNQVLQQLQSQFAALKLHLVGHSFGGRLVTAAALGQPGGILLKLQSLVLLQAAFSHNGFAKAGGELKNDGFFRPVVTGSLINGPILITHTKNDQAVGLAYPIASRLANQVSSALGDENDLFGGIGRNGAIKTPESVPSKLLPTNSNYPEFTSGKVYNLLADDFVKDHGNVTGQEISYVFLKAILKNS
jgi:hypothetical protein